MRPRKAKFHDPMRCEHCRFFHQHYVLLGNPEAKNYHECGCGHCTRGRICKRTTPHFICEEFEVKQNI